MKRYIRSTQHDPFLSNVLSITFCSCDLRDDILASFSASAKTPILAAISSRDITKSMVRVKSSNIWAYTINIKNRKDKFGDVYVQFKNEHGGPGDVYVYYDVPTTIYRRWQSAPSKGNYLWVHIRNNYKYSKLTGDKRGKLPNAIN